MKKQVKRKIHKQIKKYKLLTVIMCVVLSITFGAIAYAGNIGSSVISTLGNLSNNASTRDKVRTVDIKTSEPIGVLLLGTDTGDGTRSSDEGARADTMIYVTVNPTTKTTHMYSISRDIYTQLGDGQTYDKINAAYAYGGVEQAIKATEYLLDVPVDYYAVINMQGMKDLVDAVGGITVNNKLGFTISIADNEPAYTATIDPGEQHINGEQALVYARMRYQDPNGDVGRQERQQEVIQAVIRAVKQKGITNYTDILAAVSANVETDVSLSDMASMISSYLGATENIQTTSITGRGEMIGGVYYQVLGQNNISEIQTQIKSELNITDDTIQSDILTDPNMLLIDDSVLDLDIGTHYDFGE